MLETQHTNTLAIDYAEGMLADSIWSTGTFLGSAAPQTIYVTYVTS